MTMTRLSRATVVSLLAGLSTASGGEVARPGHWIGKRGAERTTLAVAADQGFGLLIIRCAKGQVAVSVDWARYIGSARVPVSMRIDDTQFQSGKWVASSNLRETVYPGDGSALLESLRGGRRLSLGVNAAREANLPFATARLDDWLAGRVARVDSSVPTAADEPVSVGFDLMGLERVLKTDGGDCEAP